MEKVINVLDRIISVMFCREIETWIFNHYGATLPTFSRRDRTGELPYREIYVRAESYTDKESPTVRVFSFPEADSLRLFVEFCSKNAPDKVLLKKRIDYYLANYKKVK